MHQTYKILFAKTIQIWRKIKYPFGYSLFAVVLGYSLWNAPGEFWQIHSEWLILTILVNLVMFLLQYWQIRIFLQCHGVSSKGVFPALFNARRGVLNTLLPARSGSLLLLHTLSSKYGIKWHSFLIFSLITAGCAFWVSLLAAVWLLLPWFYGVGILLSSIVIGLYIGKRYSNKYISRLWELLLLSVGIYLSTVFMFFSILRGLGYELDLSQVGYFAVVLNVLAQIAITPGNVGVREVMVGMMSPYLALPVSVGVIASSMILVLRLGVYGVIWGALEWLNQQSEKSET